MAIVQNIRIADGTYNSSNKLTYVDLCAVDGHFSIKSYCSSDPGRSGSASQNLLFNYEQTLVLRDELSKFISNYEEAVR